MVAKVSKKVEKIVTTRQSQRLKRQLIRKAPEYPKTSYQFFLATQSNRRGQVIGKIWRELEPTKKAIFEMHALLDRRRFKKQVMEIANDGGKWTDLDGTRY